MGYSIENHTCIVEQNQSNETILSQQICPFRMVNVSAFFKFVILKLDSFTELSANLAILLRSKPFDIIFIYQR